LVPSKGGTGKVHYGGTLTLHSLYGIGHSNRTLEFLVGLLLGYEVGWLIDIRTIPRSAYNPQFNKETFSANLRAVGIEYTHLPGLGGLRKPRPDSVNKGWKNSSFRGFADYMQTAEFEDNLQKLIGFAVRSSTAFMCAEAVPWRCHRSLVADALTARGITVRQIMSRVSAPEHKLTSWAVISGKSVIYPEGSEGRDDETSI
jgi:uncharacterized protein (DUF488 family)